ncbi:hypothetical protein [Bosea sp. UC22_33]|uniref:hypothetical protein n=1 Tax=Bosea sp. UC22_33 TaxID=3350165 RepID=UPI00366F77CF
MPRAVSRRNPASDASKSPQHLHNSPWEPGKSPKIDDLRACAGKIVQKDIVYMRTVAGFEHLGRQPPPGFGLPETSLWEASLHSGNNPAGRALRMPHAR